MVEKEGDTPLEVGEVFKLSDEEKEALQVMEDNSLILAKMTKALEIYNLAVQEVVMGDFGANKIRQVLIRALSDVVSIMEAIPGQEEEKKDLATKIELEIEDPS